MTIRDGRPSFVITYLCAIACIMSPAWAAPKVPVPTETHPERFEYDPQRGWVAAAEAAAGTEDGDLDIAKQWIAREDYLTALKILNSWIKQYGETAARYPEALYYRGVASAGARDYRAAHDNFQKILNNFPGSTFAEPTLSADFHVAEEYLAGKKRKAFFGLFRIRDREAGVKILDDVIANYKDTPLAELAQKTKADYYYTRGEFDMAETEYATFAREYPRSRYHSAALLRSAQSALASFPGIKFDDAGLVEAEERFGQFARQYPEKSDELHVPDTIVEIGARRADKTLLIARFYEKTRKVNAALYYYRQTVKRWPGTPAAEEAGARLAGLGEPMVPSGGSPPAQTQPARGVQ